jgi:hypothetical protein
MAKGAVVLFDKSNTALYCQYSLQGLAKFPVGVATTIVGVDVACILPV